jgi:hypothetical protein
MKKEV